MGKIFGICDNPVSTIGSAIKSLRIEPPKDYGTSITKHTDTTDKFISKEKKHVSNPFIKMRNGFGKLMAHFSRPQMK